MSKNNAKKKFNLEDLEVDSLVSTLTEEEQSDLLGGLAHPSTNCGNPAHGCGAKESLALSSR